MLILSSLTIDAERTDAMREAIIEKATLRLQEQYNPEKYRLELTARWIPVSLLQAKPEQIREVELAGQIGPSATFEVYLKGHGNERIQVQLGVKMEKRLPVAAGRLRNGDVVERDDLMWRWVPLSRLESELVEELSPLVGRTMRRTVRAGQPIHSRDIGGDYLIEAGDVVRLLFRGQGVEIELSGEARQNGGKGDQIRIYCKETRRSYLGRVVALELAIWEKTL